MKVILLQDVKGLGKKDDIIECNDAYARNCIIKKKLGIEANNTNLNNLKLKNLMMIKLQKEKVEEAEKLKKSIEESSINIKIKVVKGIEYLDLFQVKISQEIKNQLGFDIDKKKIMLENPIKGLGKFDVKIKLHPIVIASLRVEVDK